MRDIIEAFLSLPIGGRATIFVGILFLLWGILGRTILKIISILPWLLKKLFFGIYILIEIPVSILHSMFGSIFGKIDQGLARFTEKFCDVMDKWYGKMNKPKTINSGRAFAVYLVIATFLLIPSVANLTEKPFTFWHESYVKREAVVVQWMDDKGWSVETPSPTNNPAPAMPVKSDYYLLADSSRKYLKTDDLKGLSEDELVLARNEIFAKHGRLFKDAELQSYFNSKTWYRGVIAAENFSENQLNDFEKKNVELIKYMEGQLKK